jgi:acyl-CoA synthetase (AMP-forming)/AMP-acid ligase II
MPTILQSPAAIPDYIDHAATVNPNGVWAIVSESTPDGGHKWVNVTFSALARAVNQMAWWIEHNIGAGKDGEVIDYMG